MKYKVFVVMVIYNGERWIDSCFTSLNKSVLPLNIVAVDNNSTDNSLKKIESSYQDVILIKNDNNAGFGGANNQGIEYALKKNADYVFLLNQDTRIEPDTIQKLIDFHNKYPENGIISPIHLNGNGSDLDKNFLNCTPFKSLEDVYNNSIKVRTNFVNAAAWLLSKECILKIGGFDPLFTHYGEDRDFCNRVLFHNFQIAICSNAFIYHDRFYNSNNPFRKNKSLLLSAGLAQIKNINHTVVINFFKWIINRSPKIFKYLVTFRWGRLYTEFFVLTKLLLYLPKLYKHRGLSRNTDFTFFKKL